MTVWTMIYGRLDLRPETCPPSEYVSSQDPGYVHNPGLFLGLFDVTHRPAVAASPRISARDGIYHCFDLYPCIY